MSLGAGTLAKGLLMAALSPTAATGQGGGVGLGDMEAGWQGGAPNSLRPYGRKCYVCNHVIH